MSKSKSVGLVALGALFLVSACDMPNPVANTADEAVAADGAMLSKGNGAPGGHDFQLNIIGVPKDKTADMTGNNGHRIFVPLSGKVAINLVEGDYAVLDANGTDRDGALFQLPDPDVDGDGVLDGDYAIYARALGKPDGIMKITTCAELIDDLGGTVLNRKSDVYDHEDAFCSIDTETVVLERGKGKSTFQEVSDQLLSIVFEVEITLDDGSTITELIRIPLFDDAIQDEFWEVDNNGLRLAQLRFYAL
ncbi:MAG: hypothetical protein HKO77_02945 [Gemmatimonadetes bacterium]|nr:hypothetical protein [Gemmatimonadota bacterium]NNM31470.1 hypothetical protein [Gemmatimonadota bacterium]